MFDGNSSDFPAPQGSPTDIGATLMSPHGLNTAADVQQQLPGVYRPIPLYPKDEIRVPNVLLNAQDLSSIAKHPWKTDMTFVAGSALFEGVHLIEEETREEREKHREAWLARLDRQLHHYHEKLDEEVVESMAALSPQMPPLSPEVTPPPPQEDEVRQMAAPKKLRAKKHKYTEFQLDFLRNVFQTTKAPTIEKANELGAQLGIDGDKIVTWFRRERQKMKKEQAMENEQNEQNEEINLDWLSGYL